jgi:hypothetical protein
MFEEEPGRSGLSSWIDRLINLWINKISHTEVKDEYEFERKAFCQFEGLFTR